ncbi:asparagine synthetase B [Halalkalicoccus paucihalophilus]|uniref:Asparagine synthetase B n=1 Tax=Halalkalicoccus paucihalophilus TaxID=1008153 RepID=A0A151A9S6_9EURY|nr:asparagine synthase-related protein [Halalkalicoccus paucihalophilus]KYH24369.1 asparagine synthetase B [Halalkalicoccus paucihalophilus]
MYIEGSIFGRKDPAITGGANVFHHEDTLTVATTSHKNISTTCSTRDTNEPVWWVLGELYGFDATVLDGQRGYARRPLATDPAQYCARLYNQYGIEFVRGLNGNFFLLGYDPSQQQVFAVTDRLATVPIYYTTPTQSSDPVVFSSNIQRIPLFPSVETSYDSAYLHEYFAYKRTFGVKTPLSGIEELPPGSITRFDLADQTTTVNQYWTPEFAPIDKPFGWFVDEFVHRFTTVINEWIDSDQEYGVLTSGGSDSRLILAALNGNATAFHMADWMNREARTAERVASISGAEFTVLYRGADYQAGSLERNRSIATFNGWFTQPYTSGFEDEITTTVDALLSGLYGDTLFKRFPIPSPDLSIGPLGTVTLPLEQRVETIDEYIDWLLDSAFVSDIGEMPTDLRSVLETNIYRDGDQIIHHGVAYRSLDDLVYYSACYPLSNDDDLIFHKGIQKMLPYRSPFLDNRLIDLSLSMPIRYRLRRNIISQAVERLNPALAAIPHSNTGAPLTRSFPIEYLTRNLTALYRTRLMDESPPEPYMTNGSWIDDAELLRHHPFFRQAIEKYGHLADSLPGLDQEILETYYQEHCNGQTHLTELYTIMTVLSMPLTAYLASGDFSREELRSELNSE